MNDVTFDPFDMSVERVVDACNRAIEAATPETAMTIKAIISEFEGSIGELEKLRAALSEQSSEIVEYSQMLSTREKKLEYHSCVSAEKMKSEALKREKESKRMLHEASLERRSAAVIMAGARRKIKSFSMVVDRLVELEHQNMPDAERKRYDAITGGNSQSLLRRIILQKYDLSECSKGNTA